MKKWLPVLTYYVKYAAIYFVFFQTMFISGVGKLTSDGTPDWFSAQFGETFLATFPGLNASYFLLALLEIAVAVLLVISLVFMEFRPSRRKLWLLFAIATAALTFGALGFGQNLTHQYDGAAFLFFYFGATLIAFLVVSKDHEAVADE